METLLPFEKIHREVLVRKESETNPSLGFYPEKRPIEHLFKYGIINLDKPSGPSSHQVSAYAKHILKVSKTGHSGTLDPKVTGVLPIAVGKGTRVVEYLLNAGKEYICLMQLHKDVPEALLRKTCEKFVGKINQLPPIKSAVVRRIRERSIYYLEILEIDERFVLFRVGCQAGTYIRKLVSDIGSNIGGAHMLELRRSKAGPFFEEKSFTLQDLADAMHYYREDGNEKYLRHILRPIEDAVAHLPKVWIVDGAVDSLCHGTSLKVPGIARVESGIKKEDNVAVLTLKNELVCVGEARLDSAKMQGQMGVAIKPDAVFMEPLTYKISPQ